MLAIQGTFRYNVTKTIVIVAKLITTYKSTKPGLIIAETLKTTIITSTITATTIAFFVPCSLLLNKENHNIHPKKEGGWDLPCVSV